MSNEKQDEFLSWRGILDQPDALPEHGLDRRDLSWERLDAQLQRKSRLAGCLQGTSQRGLPGRRPITRRRPITGRSRRIPLRYRIAAACLLLALIPGFYLFQKGCAQVQPPAVAATDSPATASSPATATSPATASPTVISAPAPPAQELVDNTPILHSGPPRENLRKRSIPPPIKNTPPPPDSPVLIAQQQEQSTEKAEESPETTRQSAPKSLTNKPLRIVHLNELNGRSQPQPAMTSIRERDPQLRLLIVLKNQ